MNRPPDVELVLRDYLADDRLPAPDYILDVVEGRIRRLPQRRSWRLLRRLQPMSRNMSFAAALAAVIVVGVIGLQLLPGTVDPGAQPTGTPGALATERPSATISGPGTPAPLFPAPSCEDDLAGCAGPLAAGDHQTVNFYPKFNYTVPDGWENPIDVDGLFTLTPIGTSPGDRIHVWSGVVQGEATSDCTTVQWGNDARPSGWMEFLTTHPGFVATNVHELATRWTTAQVVDLSVNPDWTPPCADDLGLVRVPILKTRLPSPVDAMGLNSAVRVRVYVLGVLPEGIGLTAATADTLIVTVYSYSPDEDALAEAVAEAEPIVTSFWSACQLSSPPGPCWGRPDASGNPATPPT